MRLISELKTLSEKVNKSLERAKSRSKDGANNNKTTVESTLSKCDEFFLPRKTKMSEKNSV